MFVDCCNLANNYTQKTTNEDLVKLETARYHQMMPRITCFVASKIARLTIEPVRPSINYANFDNYRRNKVRYMTSISRL